MPRHPSKKSNGSDNSTIDSTIDPSLSLEELNKDYKKYGLVARRIGQWFETSKVSTGSVLLDCALDGGLTCPGWVEFFGEDGTGKTSLALIIADQAIDLGMEVTYFALETLYESLIRSRCRNADKLVIVNKADFDCCAENIFNLLLHQILPRRNQLVVIDSMPHLVARDELLKSADKAFDSTFGNFPRIASIFFRQAETLVRENHNLVIMLNQVRAKIQANPYAFDDSKGESTKRPGGWASRFIASQIIRLEGGKSGTSLIKADDGSEQVIGQYLTAKYTKSKVGRNRHQTVSGIPLITTCVGIDHVREVVSTAIRFALISKAGSWFEINGEKVQGEVKLRDFYHDNPEKFEALKATVEEKLRESLEVQTDEQPEEEHDLD